MNIILIPARGGSKGVPGKNIRKINGKPLIAYAIECALQSKVADHVIVSTDSQEIADIAKEYGAEVPYLRPDNLSNDTSPMLPVMQHTITQAEKLYQEKVEHLILCDPTAPLRHPTDIQNALKQLEVSDYDAIISGNTAHRNPYFNQVTKTNGNIHLVLESNKEVSGRQMAPEVYDLNTVVWIYKRSALMEEKARIPQKTDLYLVPLERCLDLDTEYDFKLLEFILNQENA